MILIKGMEMPDCCTRCDYLGLNVAIGCPVITGVNGRATDCPLIEIPPHGRLGDLDKLEQMFVDIDNAPYSGFDGTEPFYSAEDAAQIIRLAPTVIPADKDGEI